MTKEKTLRERMKAYWKKHAEPMHRFQRKFRKKNGAFGNRFSENRFKMSGDRKVKLPTTFIDPGYALRPAEMRERYAKNETPLGPKA